MLSASGSRAHRGDDLLYCLRLGRHPVCAQAAGQHLAGVGVGEQIDGQRAGAIGRSGRWRRLRLVTTTQQPGEPGSSGQT